MDIKRARLIADFLRIMYRLGLLKLKTADRAIDILTVKVLREEQKDIDSDSI